MFLAAPETKGKSLEEMDEVFDSGVPAWKVGVKGSRLDRLEREIESGRLKVVKPRKYEMEAFGVEHIEGRSAAVPKEW